MTFEEFKKEIERIKAKLAETDKRLDALEESYARLEREISKLENRLRWEL